VAWKLIVMLAFFAACLAQPRSGALRTSAAKRALL
jgi:hypothetical protein